MAIGGMVVDGQGSDNHFNGKIVFAVVITSIVAASGVLIFVFDIGISGGVTTMRPFVGKFFPSILEKAASGSAETNVYMTVRFYSLHVITLHRWLGCVSRSWSPHHGHRTKKHNGYSRIPVRNGTFKTAWCIQHRFPVGTANCINYGTSKLS